MKNGVVEKLIYFSFHLIIQKNIIFLLIQVLIFNLDDDDEDIAEPNANGAFGLIFFAVKIPENIIQKGNYILFRLK